MSAAPHLGLPEFSPQWERIDDRLMRHPVPGGWLYVYKGFSDRAMCFVPDVRNLNAA